MLTRSRAKSRGIEIDRQIMSEYSPERKARLAMQESMGVSHNKEEDCSPTCTPSKASKVFKCKSPDKTVGTVSGASLASSSRSGGQARAHPSSRTSASAVITAAKLKAKSRYIAVAKIKAKLKARATKAKSMNKCKDFDFAQARYGPEKLMCRCKDTNSNNGLFIDKSVDGAIEADTTALLSSNSQSKTVPTTPTVSTSRTITIPSTQVNSLGCYGKHNKTSPEPTLQSKSKSETDTSSCFPPQPEKVKHKLLKRPSSSKLKGPSVSCSGTKSLDICSKGIAVCTSTTTTALDVTVPLPPTDLREKSDISGESISERSCEDHRKGFGSHCGPVDLERTTAGQSSPFDLELGTKKNNRLSSSNTEQKNVECSVTRSVSGSKGNGPLVMSDTVDVKSYQEHMPDVKSTARSVSGTSQDMQKPVSMQTTVVCSSIEAQQHALVFGRKDFRCAAPKTMNIKNRSNKNRRGFYYWLRVWQRLRHRNKNLNCELARKRCRSYRLREQELKTKNSNTDIKCKPFSEGKCLAKTSILPVKGSESKVNVPKIQPSTIAESKIRATAKDLVFNSLPITKSQGLIVDNDRGVEPKATSQSVGADNDPTAPIPELSTLSKTVVSIPYTDTKAKQKSKPYAKTDGFREKPCTEGTIETTAESLRDNISVSEAQTCSSASNTSRCSSGQLNCHFVGASAKTEQIVNTYCNNTTKVQTDTCTSTKGVSEPKDESSTGCSDYRPLLNSETSLLVKQKVQCSSSCSNSTTTYTRIRPDFFHYRAGLDMHTAELNSQSVVGPHCPYIDVVLGQEFASTVSCSTRSRCWTAERAFPSVYMFEHWTYEKFYVFKEPSAKDPMPSPKPLILPGLFPSGQKSGRQEEALPSVDTL